MPPTKLAFEPPPSASVNGNAIVADEATSEICVLSAHPTIPPVIPRPRIVPDAVVRLM